MYETNLVGFLCMTYLRRKSPFLRSFSVPRFLAYMRGSKGDYNQCTKVTGDHGWFWDNLVPYMKKGNLNVAISLLNI
jgi:hypothetical protein